MRRVCAFLLLAAAAFAIPPLPRKSPEYTILVPGAKQTLLTSYRGKVVMLGFFATYCVHCQNTAKVFDSLQQAFRREGLQAVGIAINPDVTDDKVREFTHLFAPDFPVGKSNADSALSYLQISPIERWVYPQVVLIDRKGMIRFQSDSKGTPELQEMVPLRARIEELLKER